MSTFSTTSFDVGDLVYIRLYTGSGSFKFKFKEYRLGIIFEHIKYSKNNPGNHEHAYMVYIQWDNEFTIMPFFPDELIASDNMIREDDDTEFLNL